MQIDKEMMINSIESRISEHRSYDTPVSREIAKELRAVLSDIKDGTFDIKEKSTVPCEAIKTVEYYGYREVGEIFDVQRKDVDEMVKYGFVRVIGSEEVPHDK